eukprot:PLAT12884.1.p1 GENE.PLAT12884.1~~PLAT12884.1.p1  ORF type:complete len:497 (-),score=171.73 PLAT12884.1:75-1370(-)
MEDMAALGCMPADAIVRVSDHVPDIIAYVQTLVDSGHAYRTPSGVYFDIHSLSGDYGVMAPASASAAEAEEAEEGMEKRDARDFALWKASDAAGASWPAAFGHGRPGWHIECSAMTHALFGEQLDIHSGGIDLAFPHHCNEVAQCAAHGAKDWPSVFLHTGHLFIAGRKMSKSLKNFVSVREMLSQTAESEDDDDSLTVDSNAFRLFCLQSHYRAPMQFTAQALAAVRDSCRAWEAFFARSAAACRALAQSSRVKRWKEADYQMAEATEDWRAAFLTALADDIGTPAALAACHTQRKTLVRYLESEDAVAEVAYAALRQLHSSFLQFGFHLPPLAVDAAAANSSSSSSSSGVSSGGSSVGVAAGAVSGEALDALVALRSQLRSAARDSELDGKQLRRLLFTLSDELRDDVLPLLGAVVEDGPSLSTWHRKS